MSSNGKPLDPSSADFFELRYQATEDPWCFGTSPYEQLRYDRIVTALADRIYEAAFEPGCSVGVLTVKLAPLCRRLYASDHSPTAVERARQRCRGYAAVCIECESIDCAQPYTWDLVVLSEIGYYFETERWMQILDRLVNPLLAGATVIACHWLGISKDHLIHGDEVHRVIARRDDLQLTHAERHADFRLDRWVKR